MVNNFLTICLNPVIQKTLFFNNFEENEVNRTDQHYVTASGKGINVSRVLVQLNKPVCHLTHAGGHFKSFWLDMVKHEKIKTRYIDSNSEIRYCYTILNKHKKTTTELVEESCPVDSLTEKRIIDIFKKELKQSHTVIISGTKAPGYSDNLYPDLVKMAKNDDKIIILDIKGKDLLNSITHKPTIIKPNFVEFMNTCYPELQVTEHGEHSEMISLAKEKMLEFYNKYGIITILTRGEHDLLYINEGACHTVAVNRVKPVNTTGCGDAFTGGFAAEYYKTRELVRAINFGLDCAQKNATSLLPGSLI